MAGYTGSVLLGARWLVWWRNLASGGCEEPVWGVLAVGDAPLDVGDAAGSHDV